MRSAALGGLRELDAGGSGGEVDLAGRWIEVQLLDEHCADGVRAVGLKRP